MSKKSREELTAFLILWNRMLMDHDDLDYDRVQVIYNQDDTEATVLVDGRVLKKHTIGFNGEEKGPQ